MLQHHRDALTRNRVALVKGVSIDEDFLSHLIQDKTITDHMKEEVEAERTTAGKVSKLLTILQRRGLNAMRALIKALVFTHQEHIATLLDQEISREFVNERERDEGIQNVDVMDIDGPLISPDEKEKPLLEKLNEINKNVDILAKVLPTSSNKQLLKKFCSEMECEKAYNVKAKGRGRAVIISNYYYLEKDLPDRKGNEYDVKNLQQLLTDLGFSSELYEEKNRAELLNCLDNEQHNVELHNADMFMLFVLAHGDTGHFFTMSGDKVNISELVDKFDGENCKALRGKPKLFFIQACQGDAITQGVPLRSPDEHDGPSVSVASASEDNVDAVENRAATVSFLNDCIHKKSDILVGMASIPGFAALRNMTCGTLYIRCLVYVFSRKAHKEHVVDMLTEVSGVMSAFKGEKQNVYAPQLIHSLRKSVYFMPGYSAEK